MQQAENQKEIPRPPGSDMENGDKARPESHFRGLSDVQQWKKEDWMKKGVLVLVLRGCALIFSFLAFIIMVVVTGFHLDQALSYVFAVALISMVYTATQVGIKGHEIRTESEVISPEIAVWIDFVGDQVMSYMLLSSASVGALTAGTIRFYSAGYINPTVDKVSASVAMSFLAFFSLAPASLISGYHFFIELSRS